MPSRKTAPVSDDNSPVSGDAAGGNLSKVTAPRQHNVYANKRLFEVLDQALERPIVWLQGPPGAGKTTLVASYIADRQVAPLWYRLDEGDADPATLFLYLAAAWRGRSVDRSLPLLTQDHRGALPLFTRRFFRGLFTCPKTSVVVFDDYHEVARDALVHQCIAHGLEEIPNGKHVIVVSRMPPPAEFARLRLNGLISAVEPDALRITLEEAEGLAQRRGADLTTAKVNTIVQQTQGWTAGLILVLEAGAGAVLAPADETPVPEVLFDYFGGEILQRMDAGVQRLLCMLALMPATTAAAAARLTGSAEAGVLLESLRRRNYFTSRDIGAEPRYRFHPLFRDFLVETARTRFSDEELAGLRLQAADLLDEDGQSDAAVALLIEAQAADRLAALIKRRASTLIDEGRNDTLIAWLAKVPTPLIAQDGWLNYWSGMACMHTKPDDSLRHCGAAFDLFKQADDVTGQFVAWGGLAHVIRGDAFGDMGRFNPLIDALYELLARHPDIPPGPVMLRVAIGMATGLSRCRNDREEIALWQQRARAAAGDVNGPRLSPLIACVFAITDFQDANYAAACEALDTLPFPLAGGPFTIAEASIEIAYAMALLYRQKQGDCSAFVEEALRRFESTGYFLWMPLLAGLAANDATRRGDLTACGAWLRRAAAYADRLAPNRGTHYHFSVAQFHIVNGDFAAARTNADMSVKMAMETGWAVLEAFARLVRSEVLVESADVAEAEAELDRLDSLLSRCAARAVTVSTVLLKADIAFTRHDEAAGMTLLADALALGRRQGDRRVSLSMARVTRLLSRAVAANIEPNFVRAFIRASEVPAPDPDDEAWPWPLKIATFGGLTVTKDDKPLAVARKTPKRLITLLKAIVAYGGQNVPEDRLIDAIWPDEDGDAGHSALKVAVHRLRLLLGEASFIVVKGGRVGLDPARCWLDVWAFDRCFAARGAGEAETAFRTRVERGLALYRGDFLSGDDDLWWTTRPRDQMRDRHRRVAHTIAEHAGTSA